MPSRCYLVCDRCGFFYGRVTLSDKWEIECPECGRDAAWAFPTREKALDYQAQLRLRVAK